MDTTSNIIHESNRLGSPSEWDIDHIAESPISTIPIVDHGVNNVTATNPLPIGTDTTSGSQNVGLKSISSLRPILKLMNIYFDGTEWHCEIRNLNWDIVLARTAEVEEITIDNAEEDIPFTIYMLIPRPGTSLFPNLTRLQLVNEPLHTSLYRLPLFVSPRLHSLEIDNISQDDIAGLDYFLRDPDMQASLKKVSLGPIPYSSRILQAISQCTSVATVTLSFLSSKPLDYEAIRLLGTTPKLQSLTINADHVPYTQITNFPEPNPTRFAALKDICIIGVYVFIETILKDIEVEATIHSLNMTISSDWTTELESTLSPFSLQESQTPSLVMKKKKLKGKPKFIPRIHSLLSHIAKKWSSSLYDFILVTESGNQRTTDPPQDATLPPECFEKLTRLPGLRRLIVSGLYLSDLNVFLNTELSSSSSVIWPNIEELQFPMHVSPVDSSCISLSTFRLLVQRCTKLISFGCLIMLPTGTDDLFKEIDNKPIQSRLKQLSTGSVRAMEWNHMIQVARFLEKLCPELDKLTTHAKFSPIIWGNIFNAFTVFRAVRREERAALT